MVMSLSRVLWKVRSKAPTVTASVQGTVSVTGEGYTTIRDSTRTWIANEVRSRRSGDGKQDDDPGYILTPQRSPLPKGAETASAQR